MLSAGRCSCFAVFSSESGASCGRSFLFVLDCRFLSFLAQFFPCICCAGPKTPPPAQLLSAALRPAPLLFFFRPDSPAPESALIPSYSSARPSSSSFHCASNRPKLRSAQLVANGPAALPHRGSLLWPLGPAIIFSSLHACFLLRPARTRSFSAAFSARTRVRVCPAPLPSDRLEAGPHAETAYKGRRYLFSPTAEPPLPHLQLRAATSPLRRRRRSLPPPPSLASRFARSSARWGTRQPCPRSTSRLPLAGRPRRSRRSPPRSAPRPSPQELARRPSSRARRFPLFLLGEPTFQTVP